MAHNLILDASTISITTTPASIPVVDHPEGAMFRGSNLGCSEFINLPLPATDTGTPFFVAMTVNIFDPLVKQYIYCNYEVYSRI